MFFKNQKTKKGENLNCSVFFLFFQKILYKNVVFIMYCMQYTIYANIQYMHIIIIFFMFQVINQKYQKYDQWLGYDRYLWDKMPCFQHRVQRLGLLALTSRQKILYVIV